MGSTRAKSSFLKWLSRVALFSAKVSFRRTSNTLLHKKEKLNRRTQLTAPTTKATVRKRKMQKNISLVIWLWTLTVDSFMTFTGMHIGSLFCRSQTPLPLRIALKKARLGAVVHLGMLK